MAARQHGAFASAQAASLGLDRERLRAWARTGEIQRVAPRVFRLSGSPVTEHQQLVVTLLRSGRDAAVALASAAAWWDLPGYRLLPAQTIVLRAREAARPSGGHTSSRFHDNHVTAIGGLRITTPTRTLFDLAGRQPREKTEGTLERALQRGLTSVPGLVAMLEELAGRGRRGISLMRELIEERLDPGYQPTESRLESRFEEVATRGGFHGLRRQVTVGDEDGVIGRMDFVHRWLPLVVEVQSDLYHRGLLDRQRDVARIDRLRRAGFVVVEIFEWDVWHDQASVVAALDSGYREAESRRSGV